MSTELPERLADAKTMEAAFSLLRSYPMMRDFLAYQFVTDINYSRMTSFSESEFVVAGPGAIDGVAKCFEWGMSPSCAKTRSTWNVTSEQLTRRGQWA